nr:hypothetical protein [uncultured Actinoplanes sp.]
MRRTEGTWQVFDQIYVMSQGNPAKTTLTPAFLSYRTAFRDFDYGSGAAISFVLFLIIVVLTLLQRWLLRRADLHQHWLPHLAAELGDRHRRGGDRPGAVLLDGRVRAVPPATAPECSVPTGRWCCRSPGRR